MDKLEQFKHQQYINLETFRRNGEGMKTPVWFVQDGKTLFVRTVDESGKVKRIRNNGHVNVALCKMDGGLLSEWIPAQARSVADPSVDKKVARLIYKKYSLMGILLSINSRLRHAHYAILEIKLSE